MTSESEKSAELGVRSAELKPSGESERVNSDYSSNSDYSAEVKPSGESERVSKVDKVDSEVKGEREKSGELKPIGKGKFGNIYDQFKGKAKEALAFLKEKKEGDLLGVFHREDIGDIDLVWGDEKSGLSHINNKHVGDNKSFATLDIAIERIEDIIKSGDVTFSNGDKVVLKKGDELVTLRKNIREKGKKTADKNWILTAYNEKAADNTSAISAVNKGQAAPTTAVSGSKGSEKVAVKEESSAKSDEDSKKAKELAERSTNFDKVVEAQGGLLEGKPKRWNFNMYQVVGDKSVPVMSGVYMNEQAGEAVATNKHVLVTNKRKYDVEKAGKIITKSGEEIFGSYPDYKSITPKIEDTKDTGASLSDIKTQVYGLQERLSQLTGRERKRAVVELRCVNGKVLYAMAEDLVLFAKALNDISGSNVELRYVKSKVLGARKLLGYGEDGVALCVLIDTVQYNYVVSPKDKKFAIELGGNSSYSNDSGNSATERAKEDLSRADELGAELDMLVEEARKRAEKGKGAGEKPVRFRGNEELGIRSAELGDVANDFYLTKDNQADFEYALMESIGGGKYSSTYGYKTIDGVRVRVKGHTPNWDNFVDWDTGEPVSDKILNVTVGDYDSSDYRRNKASLDEFKKEYPGVKTVDVEIADGTYLGDALAKIEGALKDNGIAMEFNPSYTWAEKYTKENNNLGGGVRFRGEDDIRFRFIGEKGAEALDKSEEASTRMDNLAVAREMESAGKDAKSVKMATGWERGADGKWRYETADELTFDLRANVDFGKRKPEIMAGYKRYRELLHKKNAFYLLSEGENLTAEEEAEFKELKGKYKNTQLHNSRKLKDYLDAPELFTAYPELRNVEVRIEELSEREHGRYNAKDNTITLSDNLSKAGYKSTLVHEIQHAIQHIEGFARGGSEGFALVYGAKNPYYEAALTAELVVENAKKKGVELDYDKVKNLVIAIYNKTDTEAMATEVIEGTGLTSEEFGELYPFDLQYQMYKRFGGEVEARNVSKRMGMSEEERRNSLAVETEDVSRKDQIFLMDNLGVSAMEEASEELSAGGRVPWREGEEIAGIVSRAKAEGTYMKAPNGKASKLDEKQWAQVRTKAFKNWFGDWEKEARIEKLRASKPIEIEFNNEYELNRDSAKQWLKDNVRGEYVNKDTNEKIAISKIGINEVTSHGSQDTAHIISLKAIPNFIEDSIFIEEIENTKDNDKYDSYRYYVCGAKIGSEDYTVKIVVGVKGDSKYYDHRLTQIEKGSLIDNLNGLSNSVVENQKTSFDVKDNKLVSILQANASKVVDENGEPLVVYHGSTERFTVFDRSKLPPIREGFYFTDRKDLATKFAGRQGVVNSYFLNIKSPLRNGFDGSGATMRKSEYRDGGIFVKRQSDRYAEKGTKEIIVFEPNQIKSATDNVGSYSRENDDIRFRFIGEKGAEALDKSEEASTRMDNLAVAREMESAGKDAKSVKMATGWERGA